MAILPNIKLPLTPTFTCPRDLAYAPDELPPPIMLAMIVTLCIQGAKQSRLFLLLADRLGGGRRGKYSYLRLHFNH